MSDIVEEVVWGGGYKAEIDEWGGCHFHFPDDAPEVPPLSLSPEFIHRVEEAREKVITEDTNDE